jgi:DNA-directed RNA polymerase beta subunit
VCRDDQRQLTTVQIPYACKLLFQELNAMGIRTQIFPSDTEIGVPKVIEK